MLVVIVAGALQVSSLGDKQLAKDLSELFVEKGDTPGALRTFLEAPGLVIWRNFDFATVVYFLILTVTTFILAEAYQTLVNSRLGKSVRKAQVWREILLVEQRIQNRMVARCYVPLFTFSMKRNKFFQSVDMPRKSVAAKFCKWAIDFGLCYRLCRILLASATAILYFLLLRGQFHIENTYLLGITWLVLLTLACVEASWLRVGMRGLGFLTASAFASMLALYVVLVDSEVERGFESSIILIIILVVIWVLGTFCGFSPLGNRAQREEWLEQNLYVWGHFEVSAVGQFGSPVLKDSSGGAKRVVNKLMFPIRNRVAAALFAAQMKNDIAHRFEQLDRERGTDEKDFPQPQPQLE